MSHESTLRLDAPFGGFLRNPLNWLLLFVPVTVVLEHVGPPPPPVLFFSAALAVVPVAALIVRATEQLAARAGDAAGGLLNAAFGNAPELIISLVALRAGYLGSCIQIALFVAPMLVLASYFIAPEPLALAFNRAEVGSLLVAMLIGALVCGDGQSNWYKGVQLITVYVIIALMFYLIPALT